KSCKCVEFNGIRTRDTAVKGRCLNHLTNGPCILAESKGFEPLRPGRAYMISNQTKATIAIKTLILRAFYGLTLANTRLHAARSRCFSKKAYKTYNITGLRKCQR